MEQKGLQGIFQVTQGKAAASQSGALRRLIRNPSHHQRNSRLHLDRVRVMVRDARCQGLPCGVLERMPMQCNDIRIIAQLEARVNRIFKPEYAQRQFWHGRTEQGRDQDAFSRPRPFPF